MARYIRYLAPSLTAGDFSIAAQALADSGYSRATPGGAHLTLTARALTLDAGSFLEIDAYGDALWDPFFARALSAAADGFTFTMEYLSVPGHYGEALFFAGRTLQARSWSHGENELAYGPPLNPEEQHGVHVLELYQRRFEILCEHNRELIGHGKVLATENWEVAPHPVRFRAEEETLFSLILVGNVAAEDRERLAGATAFAGWRRRLRCTPSMGLPYAEMRRDGPLDTAIVQEVSRRLNCSAVGLEVPGAARGFHWASAWKGDLEDSGEARSAVEFAQILHPLSFQIGETPGMLFGRGGGGWLAGD